LRREEHHRLESIFNVRNISPKNAANELPVRPFKSATAWQAWLAKNHASSPGIWMRLFKLNSGHKSITYPEALLEALCYGWIDGLRKAHDAVSYLQRFTPRRPKSIWSKINTRHARRLIKAGRMQPAGLQQIEAAKKDARWNRAYPSPANAKIPDDFLKSLEKNKKAKACFATFDKRNTFSIAYRLQSAKRPETREKRMKAILQMLARGEKFHP
jgi:uncharacterized protein YdeI (YjbR/CyaY-like superfamily)